MDNRVAIDDDHRHGRVAAAVQGNCARIKLAEVGL
jgi:hypothetical protein